MLTRVSPHVGAARFAAKTGGLRRAADAPREIWMAIEATAAWLSNGGQPIRERRRAAVAARRGLALPAFSRAAHSDAYIGAKRATPST